MTRDELVHRYDHRLWWTNPSEEITYALFDEARFAPWPDDRRVRFVPASALSHAVRAPAAPSYREALRERCPDAKLYFSKFLREVDLEEIVGD